jgi:3-phenylpropionate/cinnamic acid dioxygenase small subunit
VEEDDVGMTAHAQPRNAARIELQDAVEFIWREADLLDAREYERWLQLWTADGRYVIPIERDVVDYAGSLNIAYDDGPMREARVRRLRSGLSISATAAARTVRTLSRFVRLLERPGMLELRCAQHVVEQKREHTRVLAADVTYRLVRGDDALALDLKVIHLIDSDEAQHGIGYLL